METVLEKAESSSGEQEFGQEWMILKELKDKLNLQLVPEVAKLYREMERRSLLVRSLELAQLSRGLIQGLPLELALPGEKCANAAKPTAEGIALAFAESRAHGIIRCLISFDPRGLDCREVKTAETEIRDKRRYAWVKRVEGSISPEKVKHVVFRIPYRLFPAELMIESEENNEKTPFIFRGARL